MSPLKRKIVFAISFEAIGIALATGLLLMISDASGSQSLVLSTICASVALAWNFVYNTAFERWEASQPIKGRPFGVRVVHMVLFETGLTVLLLPLMAWWLDISLWQALTYEMALIIMYLAFTYGFTWAFDRLFGLPQSAL